MTHEAMDATHDLVAFVRARATRDPTFREALLADPREAISQALGVELPSNVTVAVNGGSPEQVTIHVPPEPGSVDHPWFAQGQPAAFDGACCCCC